MASPGASRSRAVFVAAGHLDVAELLTGPPDCGPVGDRLLAGVDVDAVGHGITSFQESNDGGYGGDRGDGDAHPRRPGSASVSLGLSNVADVLVVFLAQLGDGRPDRLVGPLGGPMPDEVSGQVGEAQGANGIG